MEIIVCIKQVPALSDGPMDEEKGVILRTGENILNPYDGFAIETALRIREAVGGRVTALTMGPAGAEKVLQTAVAMGVDRGVRMTDRAFAGADVFATARTLAAGITALGQPELIICGQQTTDGDTAQVPFSLGAQLGLPVIGWVTEVISLEPGKLLVAQELTGAHYRHEVTRPIVLAITPDIFPVRLPGIKAKMAARKYAAEVLTLADLGDNDPEHYGLTASPTRVKKIYRPDKKVKAAPIYDEDGRAAGLIAQAIEEVRCGG